MPPEAHMRLNERSPMIHQSRTRYSESEEDSTFVGGVTTFAPNTASFASTNSAYASAQRALAARSSMPSQHGSSHPLANPASKFDFKAARSPITGSSFVRMEEDIQMG